MRAVLLLMFGGSLIPAQDNLPRSTPKTDIGTGVKDASVDYWDSIADYFRNSRRAVMALRNKGVPDEEIPAVLHIARNSNASPNQVLEARKAGKSWTDIASQYNVKFSGSDIPTEANIQFLSAYHGRTPEEVRGLKDKGASWIAINQEFRRSGTTTKARTTK